MLNTTIHNRLSSFAPIIFLIASHLILMGYESSRMFWPYMIFSYLIAGAYYYKRTPASYKSLQDYFFSKDLWFHNSSINDYTLFLFNFVVYYHFFAYLLSDWVFLQDTITTQLNAIYSPISTEEPGVIAAILYTILLMLLGELAYYITHRAYHEIPFLWELHKVHHSAEVMTPITFIRSHPIDLFIQNSMRLISIAIASGIFLSIYPSSQGAIMVAGIDAAALVYYLIGANLHHSHIWISFGRPLEYIFISPAQHQIHHSTNPKHFDKNYGSMLAIWDWMFKSLYIPEKHEDISFGLGKVDYQNYNTTTKLLYYPIEQMILIAAGAKKAPKKKRKKA